MPSSIQVLSDIHLEIERSQDTVEYETFKVTPVAPILALLGDIGTANDPRLFEFIRTQLHQFKAVLYVLGNHEFYWNSYVSSILPSEPGRLIAAAAALSVLRIALSKRSRILRAPSPPNALRGPLLPWGNLS